MIANRIRPIAGMLTAVFLILLVAGIYFYATQQQNVKQPSWSELSDQAKLDRLAQQEAERETSRADNQAELYGPGAYCDRIDNQSLRERCQQDTPRQANTTTGGDEAAAATSLAALQNVSTNDERRYNRADLYGDRSYCDEITDEDLRSFCYDEVNSTSTS